MHQVCKTIYAEKENFRIYFLYYDPTAKALNEVLVMLMTIFTCIHNNGLLFLDLLLIAFA